MGHWPDDYDPTAPDSEACARADEGLSCRKVRARSPEPWTFDSPEEAEEYMRSVFEEELNRTLSIVEQDWRCQLGSELFASAVDCARAGLMTHELFALLDSDMVADTGDDRWHHNAPLLKYGPELPYWHPIKRAEVDADIPF